MKKKVAVVAFGGNAILPSAKEGTQADQFNNAAKACDLIEKFVDRDYEIVIVHGNGPQVGNLLIQMERASERIEPYSLDVAVAMTQGSMGYMLDTGISNGLAAKGKRKEVLALSSQVEVDPNDPAMTNPTKPVGPFYEEERAKELMAERGWTMVEDSGRGWRKVVASPKPIRVLGENAIRRLLEDGTIVISGGGGGVPVAQVEKGVFKGIEAVIDKDYTASLIARSIGAEMFTILTEIEQVFYNFGKPDARALAVLPISEAKKYLEEGQFPNGSMGPKIRASIEFIEAGGKEVLITCASALHDALEGKTGTRIVPDAN